MGVGGEGAGKSFYITMFWNFNQITLSQVKFFLCLTKIFNKVGVIKSHSILYRRIGHVSSSHEQGNSKVKKQNVRYIKVPQNFSEKSYLWILILMRYYSILKIAMYNLTY